jgi:hypothetical protein
VTVEDHGEPGTSDEFGLAVTGAAPEAQPQHRVLSGIDGLLVGGVIGDGKLVVSVDFAIRRPPKAGRAHSAETS